MRDRFSNLGAAGRLAGFAALLAAVAAAAAGVGLATGSSSPSSSASAPADAMAGMAEPQTPAARQQASGLASSAAGFTFEPQRTRFSVGRGELRFRIADAEGRARHDFTEEGGVRLHLIVVRRDLTGYTHVHPRLEADGSWSIPLSFSAPGVYRAFADFERDGEKTVLGTDLFVAGALNARTLPAPARSVLVDGYRVTLDAPALRAGVESPVTFTITRGGVPVRRLQDYVGMRGHLVALHEGDLAYSHVHPLAGSARGEIDFHSELQAPGRYRLFLQFKTEGRVHTAAFTVEAGR